MAQQEANRQEQEREQRRRRREGRVAAASPNPRPQSQPDHPATTFDMEPINPYRSPRLASLASAAEYEKLQSRACEDGPLQPESSRRTLSPKRGSSATGKASNVVPAKSGSVRSSPRTSALATASPPSSSSKKLKAAAAANETSSPAASGSYPKKSPRGGVSRAGDIHIVLSLAGHLQAVFCLSTAAHSFQCMCI